MNYYIYKTDKFPECKTCGRVMDYWTPGQEEYEHPECAGKRISNEMIKEVKKDLSDKLYSG